eukprot:11809826-Heterocapsa_arctica.AAC.1
MPDDCQVRQMLSGCQARQMPCSTRQVLNSTPRRSVPMKSFGGYPKVSLTGNVKSIGKKNL